MVPAARLLYVIRHGETDWNAAQRWQGHTDVPLNARGRAQARSLCDSLRSLRPSGIVSSDLARALETAEIVADELGIGVPWVDAGLRERSFGCFEGLTREECAARHPEAWARWILERLPPPGAETQAAVTSRVVLAVVRAAEAVARPGAPALVIAHGGAMRALVAATTGKMPPPIANVAVWKVTWDGGLTAAEPFDPPASD